MSDKLELAPKVCPRCGRDAHLRYTNEEEARKRTPLCWDQDSCRELICTQCGEACGEIHAVNSDEPDRPLCQDCAADDFEKWINGLYGVEA